MSDQQSGTPEYLGGAPEPAVPDDEKSGPRWGLVAGAGAGVVAVVAAGGFGLAQLLSGSGSPADAVPADALAYASIDLDPSASQKIEALQMMQKFPALKKELGLDARDDVRKWFFEEALDDGCQGLSYDTDVAPWIGDRMAVAAVPDKGDAVAPVFAVQVTDAEAAEKGLRTLAETCGEGDSIGVAFTGEYAVLTEKQADADTYAAAAAASPLSEDADYVAWTDRIGDPGIINAYVSADAPARFLGGPQDVGWFASTPSAGAEMVEGDKQFRQDMVELYRDFEGAAATVRFDDGKLDVSMATKGLPNGLAAMDATGAPALGDLPASTAAAVAVSFPEGWIDGYLDTVMGLLSPAGESAPRADDLWKELEAGTGLQLPEDIETLLGDGLRFSLDSSVDPAALETPDVPEVPFGVRINGDAAEIDRVVDTLLQQLPPAERDVLKRSSGDGYVVLGLDQAYVDQLASGGGDLADDPSFQAVLPEADRATSALYVGFDAGDWVSQLTEAMFAGDPQATANIEPLDALGVSSWLGDDQVQYGQLVLSTD